MSDIYETNELGHTLVDGKLLVCVICGEPYQSCANRCPTCNGMCSWGFEKGGESSSWTKTDKGYVPNPPPNPTGV